MKRFLAIVTVLLMGCTGVTGPIPANAEISEQFVLTVNRDYSRVFYVKRLMGGTFTIQTGIWTARFSPAYGKENKDTLEAVCRLWVKKLWNIDTPEESRLIGVELQGIAPPDDPVGPFPAPDETVYKIKTGVRMPELSYPFTTTDTAVVFSKFHSWLLGQWDIDRPNEPGFVQDSMYVGP